VQDQKLARFIILPELNLSSIEKSQGAHIYHCEKVQEFEHCPRCNVASNVTYDRRWVKVRDEPIRRSQCMLRIKKRRLYCKQCRKLFTEPVSGILKGQRTTQRFKRALTWGCSNMRSLKAVRENYQCSNSMIYKSVFAQLEIKLREYNNPWPKVVGVDEHFFSRRKGYIEFFTIFTDLKGHRVREAVHGRTKSEVLGKVGHIKGRESVEWVVQDLSEGYRSLTRELFPNAKRVADKFHVLRLLSPALRRRRIEITGDRRTLRIKRLLQKNRKDLDYFDRQNVDRWLSDYPELNLIYRFKEKLHELYRNTHYDRAVKSFDRLILELGMTDTPELLTLRKTLRSWREEILNYFKKRITNAMTEGFNRVASLEKNLGFGYRNEKNYRLRFLSACAT
jgi:transposase